MIRNDNEVGHPITNMLMSQASAGDMSSTDHADAASVIALADLVGKGPEEVATALNGAGMTYAGQPVQVDQVEFYAPDVSGPVTLEDAEVGAGHVTDQTETSQADNLVELVQEVENLVEGARDAIVLRLEQFDVMQERVARVEAKLGRVEMKLDRLMEHFGIIWNPGA